MNKDKVYLYWNNRRCSKGYKVAELYKEYGKFYSKYIVEMSMNLGLNYQLMIINLEKIKVLIKIRVRLF